MNKPMKNIALAIVSIALLVLSFYSFYNAYHIWSKYQWALLVLENSIAFFPELTNSIFAEVFFAIREYVMLFPQYFLVGLIALTSALILIVVNSRRRSFIIATLLIVSSAFLFFEAYKIWEIYRWAILQTTTPPLSYYGDARAEAIYAYETLFLLYLLIGSFAIASGLILTAITIKKHYEAKIKESTLKPTINRK